MPSVNPGLYLALREVGVSDERAGKAAEVTAPSAAIGRADLETIRGNIRVLEWQVSAPSAAVTALGALVVWLAVEVVSKGGAALG